MVESRGDERVGHSGARKEKRHRDVIISAGRLEKLGTVTEINTYSFLKKTVWRLGVFLDVFWSHSSVC